MRLRLSVATAAEEIPWREVLRPGRGLSYELLAAVDPALGGELHNRGWKPHGMVPFGYGAPTFPDARRRRGRYVAAGTGYVEFGSPLLAVVESWAKTLANRELLDWGGVALRLRAVEPIDPPDFGSGYGVLRTVTPVVMKGSGRDVQGRRTTRQAWLLPTEPEFPPYFSSNLRRKAESLGLDADVTLERITWIGVKRSFAVSDGHKVGAPAEVELRGAPETLRALWSWGLGQANSAGFGWVGS